jgi:DNA-binding beta-propeller fold protein YncE
MTRVRASLVAAAALLLATGGGIAVGAAAPSGPPGQDDRGKRPVVFVANAEGGTVSIVDVRRLEVVREIDVLPDGEDATVGEDDPAQALFEQRLVEAAGGENFAQDQDISPDGRVLYVSRGHRGDVAAFDLRSGAMLWKLPVAGVRSDHMTLSDDGRRLYVSALTDNRVEVIDTRTAAKIGSFTTGEWPHDNHLSHDGRLLYNGSIGNILTPEEARDARSGVYQLTVVDAHTFKVVDTHEFERGIRPIVVTPNDRRMYAQLSEYHGIVEFDLRRGRIVDQVELPVDEGVTEEDYDFEAPHHGLALSGDERTLCAAGRASDYVALVSRRTMRPREIIEVGDAPGWAESGPGGRRCFVTNTREDTLSVISYAKRDEVERIPVGDGPKHLEPARIPRRLLEPKAETNEP